MELGLQCFKTLATRRYFRHFSQKNALDTYFEPPGAEPPADFRFFPTFLNGQEQQILLLSALRKLDDVGSREARRRRRGKDLINLESPNISDLFLPDEYYNFEEVINTLSHADEKQMINSYQGHYDGVIMHFRETFVTSWPGHGSLESILLRLRNLLPTTLQGGIQTHLLHLASNGHIMPHVDNTEASGSWIAAVSLGGERILRMEHEMDKDKSFELLLPSGSAYVQRYPIDNGSFNYPN